MGNCKFTFLIFILFGPILAFAQLDNKTIHDLKEGRVIYDTSYIYWLPYEPGKKFFLIQGWQSQFSHKGELSLDFKMKAGNKIYKISLENAPYKQSYGEWKENQINKSNIDRNLDDFDDDRPF